jgi:hypothetical protein
VGSRSRGFAFGGTSLGEGFGEMGEDPPEVALVGGAQAGKQRRSHG